MSNYLTVLTLIPVKMHVFLWVILTPPQVATMLCHEGLKMRVAFNEN